MQIGTLNAATYVGRTAAAAAPPTARAAGATASADSSVVTLSEAARTALASASEASGRDYEHMTPSEMKGVSEELWRSGKIDITQARMLQTIGMPLGRMGANGEFVPLSSEEQAQFASRSVNYIQSIQGTMKFLESKHMDADPQYGYESWRSLLAVLQGGSANAARAASTAAPPSQT